MNRRDFITQASAALGSAAVARVPAASAASLVSGSSQPSLRVNGTRLNTHLTALAEFGKNPQGGVSRVAYSDADVAGRLAQAAIVRQFAFVQNARRGRESNAAKEQWRNENKEQSRQCHNRRAV